MSSNGVSPITRNPLDVTQLVPNRVLKSIIEEWAEKNKIKLNSSEWKTSKEEIAAKAQEDRKREVKEAKEVLVGRKPLMLFTLIDTSGSMVSKFLLTVRPITAMIFKTIIPVLQINGDNFV